MIFLIILFATLGVLSILLKRTLLATLIGIQLITMSLVTTFIFLSVHVQSRYDANTLALIVVCIGGVQVVMGCGFLSRVFYQKKRCDWSQMKDLKG